MPFRAFLSNRRRNKAVSDYVALLGPALVERYGMREEFTVPQIEKTIAELKISEEDIGWAIALFRRSESENTISKYGIEQPLLDYLREELSFLMWGFRRDYTSGDVLNLCRKRRWRGGRHDNWMANHFGQTGY